AGYIEARLAGPAGEAAARGRIPVVVRFAAIARDGRRCPLGEDRTAPWRIWWDSAEGLCPEARSITVRLLLPDGRVQAATASFDQPAAPADPQLASPSRPGQ
ncbi:MAG: hypothetical protein D6740_05685, partial [Alphaproteobacteria bacterium]